MRELGAEGLTEDKKFLIVRDLSTDEQFRIPLGEHAAVADLAGGPAGSTVPTDPSTGSERKMDTVLTPREIQARIRRGESPSEVAAATGVDVSQIEPFAVPVLAEREYMAEQARKTSVRRKYVTGSSRPLGALVAEGLSELDVSIDDVTWDAARRDDGRWTITADSPSFDSPATFLFDAASRYVMPSDSAAHELVNDVAYPDSPDMALADVVRGAAAEAPAPVEAQPQHRASTEDDDQLDEQFEATDHFLDEPAPPADPVPADPGVGHHQVELDFDHQLPADVAAAEALLEGHELPPISSLKEARDRRAQTAMSEESESATESEIDSDELEHVIEHDVAVPDTQGPGKKRHERRRVPSWDEIMFGDKRD